MVKPIAVVPWLMVTPALAAQAPSVPPAAIESQPPCTGAECSNVFLQVQDQCVWVQNIERLPVVLVLSLANGATAQFVLKAANSSTAANAPYDNPSCDLLERKVQIMNEHLSNAAIEAMATDHVFMQALKTCNAQEITAQEANLKKDEYYALGSRPVRRKSMIGLGGSYMSTETYPIYWLRLKMGGNCLGALHDIQSYTSVLK